MTARKRTQRRSKARPGIPKGKRLLERARRMSKALWADLRGSEGSTRTRPSRTGGTETGQRNPWPRCPACHHRRPPESYGCDRHTVCCCGWPHDRDDEETHDQASGLGRDEDEDVQR